MKKIKRIISLFLLVIIATSFISCNENKKENKKGKFIEESYVLPKEVVYTSSMELLDDGSIALLGQDKDSSVIYYYLSKDNGKNFEKKYEVTVPGAEDGGEVYVGNTFINKKGEVTIIFVKQSAELIKKMEEYYSSNNKKSEEDNKALDSEVESLSEYNAKSYDKDGNEIKRNFNVDIIKKIGSGGEIKINNEGNIFFHKYDSDTISIINGETLESIKDIKIEGYIGTYAPINNNLIINNFEKVYNYNIETGKKKEIKDLNKYITKMQQIYSGKDDVYFSSTDGLYKYSFDKKKTKQLIDGQLSSFGTGSFYALSFIEISKEEFLILSSDTEGLLHYTYDSKAKSKPDNEITVYSLYEDSSIRDCINKFQKEHNDMYVKYEVGIDLSSNKEINETDVIKKLNTEVMAGKGPDIIILDGLPVDSYSEKGVLEDLSKIINKKKDSYFTNVYNAYKNKDNNIYAFPLRIQIPIIGSNCYDVSKIKDLNSLTKAVEELSSNKGGSVLDTANVTQLIYYFYYSCSASWINKDNTINEKNLKEFLECTKKIYDANNASISDIERQKDKEMIKQIKEYITEEEYNKYSIYGGNASVSMVSNAASKLAISYVNSYDEFTMYEGCKEIKPSANYSLWNGQLSGYFVPASTIGISSKSKHKDVAKEFVTKLLFGEYIDCFNGISSNKEVFLNKINSSAGDIGSWCFTDNNEQEFEVQCKEFNDEQKSNLIKLIESGKTCALINKTILEKIEGEVESYILEKESLDKTISNIKDKLELYLSE